MADELENELQEEIEAAVEDAPASDEPLGNAEASTNDDGSEAELKPEPVEEPKPAPKMVPLSALLEERDKRKAAETEIAIAKARQEERERIENERRTAEQQQRQLQQQQAPAEDVVKTELEKQAGKRPAEDDDPIGAQEWDRQYRERRAQYAAEEARQTAARTELNTRLAIERQEFTRENPDYMEALNWTIQKEKEDYIDMGLSEQEALFEINRRAGELINVAIRSGKNVAATFYNYAKRRGYTKATPESVKEEPKGPTAEEKLQTSEAGKKITSLASAAGGSSPTGGLTDDQIFDLPSDKFNEWLKNPKNEERYRRMLGAA